MLKESLRRRNTFAVHIVYSRFDCSLENRIQIQAMSNNETRILVVDDDDALRDLLQVFFDERGLSVTFIEDARDLNQVVMRERPSIIVLDLMMPGIDGLTALTRLRADDDNTPVIMLTAHADEIDRVVGLEMGADDYLGKPFMPRELLARINAVLRSQGVGRSPSPTTQRSEPVHFGRFELDFDRGTLTCHGEPQRITNSELRLLNVLVRHPMETLSRSRLLTLWCGKHAEVTERGIDVPIWRLRQLIEEDPSQPRIIQTMRGIGYMFVPPRAPDDAPIA
jgi:two-component system phosphate regulon response regulator OmpR